MRAVILDEPELEFGGGVRHIDPRYGIDDHGPVDLDTPSAPAEIKIGLIGSQAAVEGIRRWLERCRSEIPARTSRHPRLFRDFPGFDSDRSFHSKLTFDDRWMRRIHGRDLARLTGEPAQAVPAAVEAWAAELERLADENRCQVIVCGLPEELDRLEEPDSPDAVDGVSGSAGSGPGQTEATVRVDFHDMLKARSLRHRIPIQIVRRETWDPKYRPKTSDLGTRTVQDEATRAWNLHTALYYKAGGVPWRLLRNPADYATCYVGVAFFTTPDRSEVHTSVAQVFNERGDGVVVQGGPAAQSKEDRQPHLEQADAHDLLLQALTLYRHEHGNFPARVVLHKTSPFNDAEKAGFNAAADDLHIDQIELTWVSRGDRLRLYRAGDNAPLRGTLLDLGDRHVLYTRGSVDFYRVYPGMYVPTPIALRPVTADHQPEELAAETLALTKLNWNDTQPDQGLPITIRAAHQVAPILKHAPPGQPIAARYAHYM
jgi:hypothetical protein